MADSTKITKNYKLMGTDNDPVVIAQRLLNLYRQLHIFSAEKKDAYNKMLMEQPPEVKRTLGSLPGGVVVQQYLADMRKALHEYTYKRVSIVGNFGGLEKGAAGRNYVPGPTIHNGDENDPIQNNRE